MSAHVYVWGLPVSAEVRYVQCTADWPTRSALKCHGVAVAYRITASIVYPPSFLAFADYRVWFLPATEKKMRMFT